MLIWELASDDVHAEVAFYWCDKCASWNAPSKRAPTHGLNHFWSDSKGCVIFEKQSKPFMCLACSSVNLLYLCTLAGQGFFLVGKHSSVWILCPRIFLCIHFVHFSLYKKSTCFQHSSFSCFLCLAVCVCRQATSILNIKGWPTVVNGNDFTFWWSRRKGTS